jgi:hypothetical protein
MWRQQLCALILAVLCSTSINARATTIKSAAGVDFGGNATFLFSDPSIQAFGVGAGYQGSIFATMWNDRPIGAKMRVDLLSLREEAVQKSKTDYIFTDSNLKSMTQNWTLVSFGAEGRFEGHGQILFWEALLGYALGSNNSNVSVTRNTTDQGVIDTSQSTSSGFALSGGVGIKRIFSPKITGLMSLRSMALIGPPYSSGALANKSYIPVPVMFSVGAEMPFEF